MFSQVCVALLVTKCLLLCGSRDQGERFQWGQGGCKIKAEKQEKHFSLCLT